MLICYVNADAPAKLVFANGQALEAGQTIYHGLGMSGLCKGVHTYLNYNRTHTSATAIPFNIETRDDASFHSTSSLTTRLTVPAGENGWYIITGKVGVANNSSITYVQTYIVMGGGLTLAANMAERSDSTGDINAVVTAAFYLSYTQYVELFVNAGGVSSFTLKGAAGQYQTNFAMVRLVV
jgi:hypothetical protein